MLFLIIGSNLYKVNDLNFPLLITLLTFGFRSLGYFSQLVISYSKLKIEFKSFYEVVSKLNVINNSLHKNTQHSSFNPTNPPLSHIYIKNLSFSYFNNISILDNITVKIPLGGHIVVYGKSGSGKSTFLDILTGMIHTSKGQISLFDINGKSHANNSNLYAYVSQNVGLFGSNLKECICGEHKFDQVNFDNVVRICQLSKVLNQCETSFSMAKFSGGEKSRIALARAIYYQRQILILDESLSSVELSLEKKIIEEIKSEYPYITILQVLHERNSSIVPDYKLVFENSKVEVFKI
jgi:ABC-type bacteriocin/lantibiotic exporter with double-glycine peptidase domain